MTELRRLMREQRQDEAGPNWQPQVDRLAEAIERRKELRAKLAGMRENSTP